MLGQPLIPSTLYNKLIGDQDIWETKSSTNTNVNI